MTDDRSLAERALLGEDVAEVVDFDIRADLGGYSFLDAFADVFTPPEHQTIHRPNTGRIALILDGFRIRRDFDKAFATLDRGRSKSN